MVAADGGANTVRGARWSSWQTGLFLCENRLVNPSKTFSRFIQSCVIAFFALLYPILVKDVVVSTMDGNA